MGYKGMQMTNQEDYIFSDTIPYNPEFDLEELRRIQNKIEDYTSEMTEDGITKQEAEVFLDWVTFNARSYATRNIPESALTAPLTGQCAPTQTINCKLLRKMGLNVSSFNTSKCIGEIPMAEEDIDRVKKGFDSPAVRHSVSLVCLPIMDNKGQTNVYRFMLDPTFRQFCLKENCDYNKFFDERAGHVAPHPGYFMQSENLEKLGVDDQTAKKTEELAKQIISRGYFLLNEENAKLYGDTFVRASRRLEFQDLPIDMKGKQYIENFETIPMQPLRVDDEEKYTKTPSNIEEKKQGILSKMINWIKNKFHGKEPLMLEEGSNDKTTKNLSSIKSLTPEELSEFRDKEKNIIAFQNQNPKEEKNPERMNEER